MGGESRYPVKIPSNQINNIKYYSSNSYSTPTKGRVPTTFAITPLDPYFVTGFSDAASAFGIAPRSSELGARTSDLGARSSELLHMHLKLNEVLP
jgi:hypothetical protein